IEAFDQPWKRLLEGTVGGHWGLLCGDARRQKHEWGARASDHQLWRWQAAAGLLLSFCMCAAAFAARRIDDVRPAVWAGVAANAIAGGLMAGVAAEKMPFESLGVGGWTRSAALVALAI